MASEASVAVVPMESVVADVCSAVVSEDSVGDSVGFVDGLVVVAEVED